MWFRPVVRIHPVTRIACQRVRRAVPKAGKLPEVDRPLQKPFGRVRPVSPLGEKFRPVGVAGQPRARVFLDVVPVCYWKAAAKISVYLINSSMGEGPAGKIVLAVDSSLAERALREITDSGTAGAKIDKEVGLLSLVGDKVGSPDLASKALQRLSECGVPVEGVSSTATTLTCITSQENSEEGVRALHSQMIEKQEE